MNFRVGSVWVLTIFWSHQIWVLKVFRIFSFTKHSGLWSFQWEDWSGFHTFFGHTKFEVKNFSELFWLWSALDSEFVSGVWVPTFFGHAKFDWTLNFSEEVSGHQLFLVTKFEVTKFFRPFYYLTSALWTLKFSGREEIWVPTFFGHA